MHICLFDIDGTLIHTQGAGKAALFAALRTAFGIAEPADRVEIHGRTDRGITRDLFQHHGIDDSPVNWERFRDAYLKHLPDMLSRRPGVILPGIVQLLEQLRDRDDIAVGLLTGNTRRGATVKLRHFGLDRYFAFGGFGDDHIDRADVAREALAVVTERFHGDVDLNRVWVIGDTPGDVRCGRAIGVKVIAVATGDTSAEELAATRPDHLAENFSDVDALSRLWI